MRTPIFRILTALLLAARLAGAQEARVIDRVTASTDSAMHYAIQLPPGHTPTRRYPTLLIMDPRGGAIRSMRLFAEPAARLGWIVMSSYETASDDDNAPNAAAANAMLADARAKWSADPQRFYLAGFSGTARVAWTFSAQMRGAARGVIAAGAGLTGFAPLAAMADTGEAAVAFAASVGDADFNWSEVKATDADLAKRGTPHRTWLFNGGHSWPPARIAAAQLEWLEALAMRTGFANPVAEFLDARRTRLLREADSLVAAGKSVDALPLLRDVAEEFRLAPEGAAARATADALEASPAVKAARDAEAKLVADEASAVEDVAIVLTRVRILPKLPSAKALADELRIPAMQQAIAKGDPVKAASAHRRLDRLMGAILGFEPRTYMQAGDAARAQLMIDVGATVDSTRARQLEMRLGLKRAK